MNRILIVGHPTSGYQDVESVLQQCGMSKALPSRREILAPQDITATLCKAHQVPNANSVTTENDIQQLEVAPVWHGMALDLILGNLDQELWGWADSQAIFALDYWKQLDDKLTFVLVYDEPQRALRELAAGKSDLSTPVLEHFLDNWTAYNGALLRFFLRNADRCLLVHTRQVRSNADDCLQQLQQLLSTPLPLLPVNNVSEIADTFELNQVTTLFHRALLPTQELTDIVSLAGLEPLEVQDVLQGAAVENYLMDQVLAAYPNCLQLYAELQSVASLSLHDSPCAHASAITAWRAMVQQRALSIKLARGLHNAYQGMSSHLDQVKAEQVKESELLQSQLYRVQEELEQYYTEKNSEIQLQNMQIAQKDDEKEKLNKALSEAKKQLDEANIAAQQKRSEQDSQLKTLGEENDLLLAQLHRVQEELERYYLDNELLKKLQTPAKPAIYGAAQRIKQQLSYRLGAVMIDRSRSLTGWIGMPFALIAETRDFRQQKKARALVKLPPIHTYRDAHEAERVKRHLSYRLGQTLLENGKSPLGWIKLPFSLRRDVKQFRLQRKEV